MSTSSSPESRVPSPLPPSERDFTIYHAIHIAGCSTRSQADLHEISQTRVRQIVRRVVEWLGQVLPPQTKIANEQETHLARQIAADRFQHQYEEANRFWEMTQESKYASLRLRLTTAQARLGVVGGRVDGLAADAIEGLPVPIWTDTAAPDDLVTRVPPGNALTRGSSLADSPETIANPVWEGEAPAEPQTATITNTPSKKPMSHGRAVLYYKLQHILADTDPPTLADNVAEARRILRASGAILMDELPGYANPSRPRGASDEIDRTPTLPATLPLPPSVTPSPQIQNPKSEIPNSLPPPPGDCSPFDESSPSPEPIADASPIEKPTPAIPYNDTTPDERLLRRRYKIPSRRLLTAQNPQPITTLQLAQDQPGGNLSTTMASPSTPIPESRTPLLTS